MIKYFQGKFQKGFVSIYASRMILQVSANLLGLFLPIFLYKLFDLNILWVIVYYLVRDVIYALTLPLGCKLFMNKIGIKNSLKLSIVFGALYYFIFYLMDVKFHQYLFCFVE